MSKDKSPSISKFQAAVLTQMGITPWKLASESESESVSASNNMETPAATTVKQGQAADRLAALKATIGSSNELGSKPASEPADKGAASSPQPDVVSPAVAVQPEMISLPDTVVMAMDTGVIPDSLVKDVLLAMGLDAKAIEWVASDKLGSYQNYLLAWQTGESCAVSDKQLITPANLHGSAAAKKQLWQLIWQQYGH